ncbi:MAG: YdcF family protein [Pseudomonadota bacterium]
MSAVKLLTVVMVPLGTVAILMLLGTLWAGQRKAARSVLVLLVSLITLWVAAMPYSAARLARSLEGDFPYHPVEQLPQLDAIVILGGGVAIQNHRGGAAQLGPEGNRAWMGYQLFAQGKAPMVLVSGGSGSDLMEEPESTLIRELLVAWGVPEAAILTDGASTSTITNARESAALLEKSSATRILLVTSALHLRRAVGVFRAMDLEVVPVPAIHRLDPQSTPFWEPVDFLPSPAALAATSAAIVEYLGYYYYRARGWL